MRLYVWHDVLSDATQGVTFALATSVEEARQLIIAAVPEDWEKRMIANAVADEPSVYDTPTGFYLFGGG